MSVQCDEEFFYQFSLYSKKITGLRKLLAIPLLAIYLFNAVGYQLLFSLAIQHSDEQLVQRLDQSQYQESDLVQIKLPLNLPYYNTQTNYERVDGEVTHKGVYYRYVKRRVANDTLYILCIRNNAKAKLQCAEADYAKKAASFPFEKRNATDKKTNPLSEHHTQQQAFGPVAITLCAVERTHHRVYSLPAVPLDGDFQPPEVTA